MGGLEGPTSVHTDAGLVRTLEEDGLVFVRSTQTSPELDLVGTDQAATGGPVTSGNDRIGQPPGKGEQ